MREAQHMHLCALAGTASWPSPSNFFPQEAVALQESWPCCGMLWGSRRFCNTCCFRTLGRHGAQGTSIYKQTRDSNVARHPRTGIRQRHGITLKQPLAQQVLLHAWVPWCPGRVELQARLETTVLAQRRTTDTRQGPQNVCQIVPKTGTAD